MGIGTVLFPRGNRQASARFLSLRLGLVFLAAGIWIAGVVADDRTWTGVAIAVLAVAFLLGLVGRRSDEGAADPEE